MRLRSVIFLLAALVVGCGDEPQPVEIMHSKMGVFVRQADGTLRFDETKVVPLRDKQGYGWVIYLRTNKPSIKYTEQLKLAGASEWGIPDSVQHSISGDKTTITVQRERSGDTSRIASIWSVSAYDPPGPASFTITIEDKVVQKFQFELKQ